MIILVTGGTGTLGRSVVARLNGSEHYIHVLSRRRRPDRGGVRFWAGDLTTGRGVARAVAEADVVVHCAGGPRGDEDKTLNLVRAIQQQGRTPHLVSISVVGADRVPVVSRVDRAMFGYFAMKRATERVIQESGLPWTILRAAQFYDLALQVAQTMARLPVIPAPSHLLFQPVDADEVARRMAELALGPPVGMAEDIAGPDVYSFDDLIRGYLETTGKRRWVFPIGVPGKAARAIRDGAIIAPDQAIGTHTWEDFLATHVSKRQ